MNMYIIITSDKNDNYSTCKYINIREKDTICKTGLNTDIIYNPSLCENEFKYQVYGISCYVRVLMCTSSKCKKNLKSSIVESSSGESSNVILSDRYYIFDPRTIKKFQFDVNDIFINNACYIGDIKFLEWWKNSGLDLKYNDEALLNACKYKNKDVLNWWLKSELPLKYDERALNHASEYGDVNVLEWWFKSGLPLKYDENALRLASFNGHVNVLEWWKNSGLPLKYDKTSLNFGFLFKNIIVLEWWRNSGLELKYSPNTVKSTLEKASHTNDTPYLEWWKTAQSTFALSDTVI
jgi:hypothetical protein